MYRLLLGALSIIILFSSTPCHAGEISFKAGVGYEFLSQEFFIDSLDQVGSDSLAIITSLNTSYLDNLIGRLSLSYRPKSLSSTNITGSLEQAKNITRFRLRGALKPKIGKGRLILDGNLDLKESFNNNETSDDYRYGQIRGKLTYPISTKRKIMGELKLDAIKYDSVSLFGFNHNRIGGKLGLIQELGSFSSLQGNLFYLNRKVPDSSRMEYNSSGAELSLFGFHDRGDIDIIIRLESRDYNRTGQKDDYNRLDVEGKHRVRLGQSFFTRQEVSLEVYSFDQQTYVSSDYTRFKIDIPSGWQFNWLTFGIGPHLELLKRNDDSLGIDEDYVESGGRMDFDLIKPGSFFISVQSLLGFRNLYHEDSLQSDYIFERLNLISDLPLSPGLNVNILFTAEWEWHDVNLENSQVFMLSSGLNYTF